VEIAFVISFLIGVVAICVVAERSLRRQAGSGIKRSDEERRALSRIQTDAVRSAGGQGS
jgi:hypothetical protein